MSPIRSPEGTHFTFVQLSRFVIRSVNCSLNFIWYILSYLFCKSFIFFKVKFSNCYEHPSESLKGRLFGYFQRHKVRQKDLCEESQYLLICTERQHVSFLDSPKFWENLTHPLMTGIQSDVDEVSIAYLNTSLQKEDKHCLESKLFQLSNNQPSLLFLSAKFSALYVICPVW